MAITTLSDLEPAARYSAEKLTRLLTGHEPTGEEPLMGIFQGALIRLSAQAKQFEQRASWPMPMVVGMSLAAAQIVIRSATGASRIDVEPGAGMPACTVTAQKPVPGAQVSPSAQIWLMVSTLAGPGSH